MSKENGFKSKIESYHYSRSKEQTSLYQKELVLIYILKNNNNEIIVEYLNI